MEAKSTRRHAGSEAHALCAQGAGSTQTHDAILMQVKLPLEIESAPSPWSTWKKSVLRRLCCAIIQLDTLHIKYFIIS